MKSAEWMVKKRGRNPKRMAKGGTKNGDSRRKNRVKRRWWWKRERGGGKIEKGKRENKGDRVALPSRALFQFCIFLLRCNPCPWCWFLLLLHTTVFVLCCLCIAWALRPLSNRRRRLCWSIRARFNQAIQWICPFRESCGHSSSFFASCSSALPSPPPGIAHLTGHEHARTPAQRIVGTKSLSSWELSGWWVWWVTNFANRCFPLVGLCRDQWNTYTKWYCSPLSSFELAAVSLSRRCRKPESKVWEKRLFLKPYSIVSQHRSAFYLFFV